LPPLKNNVSRMMKMKRRSFAKSMEDAVQVLLYAIRQERNMRFHFIAAALVIAASLYFYLSIKRRLVQSEARFRSTGY